MSGYSVFKFTEKMERGQYPVNIPTSLALESLFNIHPELKHEKSPHQNYDNYWLNLRTLYRNTTGSFRAEINTMLTPTIIAELMQDEWEAIKRVFDKSSITPHLYHCLYDDFKDKYKSDFIPRKEHTTKQIDAKEKMEESLSIFIKNVGKDYYYEYQSDIIPKDKTGKKTVIQTHIPHDLLSTNHFESFDLLESHTGRIKNQSLWYTKFHDGKDLVMIPFRHYFLRVFGDKEQFMPMESEFRKEMIENGKQYNWDSLTTDKKIRFNLGLSTSSFKAKLLRMM